MLLMWKDTREKSAESGTLEKLSEECGIHRAIGVSTRMTMLGAADRFSPCLVTCSILHHGLCYVLWQLIKGQQALPLLVQPSPSIGQSARPQI